MSSLKEEFENVVIPSVDRKIEAERKHQSEMLQLLDRIENYNKGFLNRILNYFGFDFYYENKININYFIKVSENRLDSLLSKREKYLEHLSKL